MNLARRIKKLRVQIQALPPVHTMMKPDFSDMTTEEITEAYLRYIDQPPRPANATSEQSQIVARMTPEEIRVVYHRIMG